MRRLVDLTSLLGWALVVAIASIPLYALYAVAMNDFDPICRE